MFNLRNFLAHAMADGSYDYEKTGEPQSHHYAAADRIINKAKHKLKGNPDLCIDFNQEIRDA
jgi:hypothetical protein